MSVRLGKVALGDLEGASGDRLECPELREAEALQVDDDERLSYGPTCGCGRGGEYLGEERLDVHEDRAPVLLRCDVAIEPPGAHRAEALDVDGAAELHNKTKRKRNKSIIVSALLRRGRTVGLPYQSVYLTQPS